MTRRPNILLSCAGRRVELLQILERALIVLKIDGCVVATDAQAFAPAFIMAKERGLVPRATHADFIPKSLKISQAHDVGFVVPTIDTELAAWAEAREDFEREGIFVMVSSPETIAIAADKRATNAWFRANGFPCPEQRSVSKALSDENWVYPCFAKPARGSRSLGARQIESPQALEEIQDSDDYIVESLARGFEVTVDAYVSPKTGKCMCVVPRKRLEVRDGEVAKARTLGETSIIDLVRRVCDSLPGARGCLCLQLFFEPESGKIQLIEINPRFGGGYPLTEVAGATYARWFIEECLGLPSSINENWKRDLIMLRYDQSVFING